MAGRVIDLGRITSERSILQHQLQENTNLCTKILEVQKRKIMPNPCKEEILGLFRSRDARKAVIADMDLLSAYRDRGLDEPSFLEAGPRADLRFDPKTVRAAVVTTGGLAPGLHCVIHSIVKRHVSIYSMDQAHGRIFGVYNSFRGLCDLANNLIQLDPRKTEDWLDQGGSKLGIVRYLIEGKEGDEAIIDMARVITTNLENNNIQIVYVIGGDGTLRVVHEIAKLNPTRSIVGIPKTMDNDILWVWQSFGFDTAVEQATRTINTLRTEADATRRVGVIELFGAESGFVAANAALASGHVNLVLIPESFRPLDVRAAERYLDKVVNHISDTVREEPHNPHAVVVVAEGVGTILENTGVSIEGTKVKKGTFVNQLARLIGIKVSDVFGQLVPVFINQPRHYIRSTPANSHDQIYCERLGALAVDAALAGYTSCMISQWLTEFVLVPTGLVKLGQKSVPIMGMFWKQVISSTGQPLSPAEHTVGET